MLLWIYRDRREEEAFGFNAAEPALGERGWVIFDFG